MQLTKIFGASLSYMIELSNEQRAADQAKSHGFIK